MKGHQNLRVEQELKNAGFFSLSGESVFFSYRVNNKKIRYLSASFYKLKDIVHTQMIKTNYTIIRSYINVYDKFINYNNNYLKLKNYAYHNFYHYANYTK